MSKKSLAEMMKDAPEEEVKDPVIEPEPKTRTVTRTPKTVNELLDELKKASLEERQTKILAKYEKELETFEKSLGKKEFLEALSNYMIERIEGKLVAAKK